MSEPLTVKTSFANISELAQGFVNRVSADQIILPAALPLGEGDWLQFIVVLEDGTPAFAGVGRCIGIADRGQLAPQQERYELTLDALGFEDDSRAVFDHMVIVRNAMLGAQQPDQPRSGAPAPASFRPSEPAIEEGFGSSQQSAAEPEEKAPSEPAAALETEEALTEEVRPLAAGPSAAPARPMTMAAGILTRPVVPIPWRLPSPPVVESTPPTGLFQYGKGGIPIPKSPPRPDLDPSLWIKPAPRAVTAPEAGVQKAASIPVAKVSGAPAAGGAYRERDREESRSQPPVAAEADPFPIDLNSGDIVDEELGEAGVAEGDGEREGSGNPGLN